MTSVQSAVILCVVKEDNCIGGRPHRPVPSWLLLKGICPMQSSRWVWMETSSPPVWKGAAHNESIRFLCVHFKRVIPAFLFSFATTLLLPIYRHMFSERNDRRKAVVAFSASLYKDKGREAPLPALVCTTALRPVRIALLLRHRALFAALPAAATAAPIAPDEAKRADRQRHNAGEQNPIDRMHCASLLTRTAGQCGTPRTPSPTPTPSGTPSSAPPVCHCPTRVWPPPWPLRTACTAG